MSGDVIKEYFVSLGFKADDSLKKFDTTIKGMASSVLKVTGLITGGAIAGAFADIAHEAEKLDKLSHFAFTVNSSVTEIERLGYVAELSGSSIDDVKSSLAGLASAAGQTALGVGRAKVIFAKLGLSVTDANGQVKDSLALLTEVGERIKTLSKAEQISVLDKLGISRGLLETITTDMAELGKEFDNVYKGASINSEGAAKNAVKFNDSLYRLKFTFSAISKSVSEQFFPVMTEGMDNLRKSLVESMPKIISSLVPILSTLISGMAKGTHIIAGFVIGVKDINDATGGLLVVMSGLIASWKVLNFVMALNPIVQLIGLVVGLITVFGLLGDDFQTFREGGKSYINWGPWQKGLESIAYGFEYIRVSILGLLHPIDTLMALIAQLGNLWGTVKEKLGFGDTSGGIRVEGIASNGVPLTGNGSATTNANKNVTLNNPVTITVTGAGSPTETANAVSSSQTRVTQNMVRNMQGNVR